MKIAILGTGTVGQTIGTALIKKGHQVRMGSRTDTNEKGLSWAKQSGSNASLDTFAGAASFGEIIINATKGKLSMDVLRSAGADNMKGKILMEIANPLDDSAPFTLVHSMCNNNSLGEEIQKAFPSTSVVKTLNTMWCGLMVNPSMIASGNHMNYLAGNDAEAKKKVAAFLTDNFGWKQESLLDLGDITSARGMEAYLLLWLRVYMATKNGAFNMQMVK